MAGDIVSQVTRKGPDAEVRIGGDQRHGARLECLRGPQRSRRQAGEDDDAPVKNYANDENRITIGNRGWPHSMTMRAESRLQIRVIENRRCPRIGASKSARQTYRVNRPTAHTVYALVAVRSSHAPGPRGKRVGKQCKQFHPFPNNLPGGGRLHLYELCLRARPSYRQSNLRLRKNGRIDLREDLGRDPSLQSIALTSPGVGPYLKMLYLSAEDSI